MIIAGLYSPSLHTVHYGYAISISISNQRHQQQCLLPDKQLHTLIPAYCQDLTSVFLYTEAALNSLTDADLEQTNEELKIKTGWGQSYDMEQMMEHAIVHVLRHTRQIKNIQKQMR